jgi:hypothetical protein
MPTHQVRGRFKELFLSVRQLLRHRQKLLQSPHQHNQTQQKVKRMILLLIMPRLGSVVEQSSLKFESIDQQELYLTNLILK